MSELVQPLSLASQGKVGYNAGYLNRLLKMYPTFAMPLNDIRVRQAKPKKKSYKLYDGNGLYIFVTPKGTKVWRMRYYFSKKEKLLVLGRYPSLSLKEARKRCDEAKDRLAQGIDPSLTKKALKQGEETNSFEGVAREWIKNNKGDWTSNHVRKIERRLEKYVHPSLGDIPVKSVTAASLLSVLRVIEKEGHFETAHRVKQDCSRIFNFAIALGLADVNPANYLDHALKPVKQKHRSTITDRKEIGFLLKSIDKYPGQPVTRIALQILPRVFVRPSELRLAKWCEFDFESCQWRIPAKRMKMREEHIVPLSRQVIKLLKELQTFSGDDGILFPSLQSGRPIGSNTLNMALHRLGYGSDQIVPHGFRSMASTLLNEAGWPPDVIERQLAHSERNKVRAAYNRAQYLSERVIMMQYWADWLDDIKAGKTAAPALGGFR